MRKKLSIIAAILAMAFAAIFRETFFFPTLDFFPNPDCSWLLLAAHRLANGEKLYVDIMETNPPLIVWLNLLPVWVSSTFGISPFLAFTMLVSMLNIYSISLVARSISTHEILGKFPAFTFLLLYVAFGFFLLTPIIYGEREVLFIALVLPYLFCSLMPGKKQKPATIFMASIGFALKPFFLLVWVANELAAAISEKKYSKIFAPHNWCIGLAQLAYFAAIYFITPEYFLNLVPTLLFTYFAFESDLQNVFQIIASIYAVSIFIFLLANLGSGYRQLALRVLVWVFACGGLMAAQRKNWPYHIYPMAFMAGLLITICLAYLQGEWQRQKLETSRRTFIALCLCASLLVGTAYAAMLFTDISISKPQKISNKLMHYIETYAHDKEVYQLNFDMQPGFPAISVSSARFHGSFHQLWPLPGIIIKEQEGENSAEFLKVKKWFFDSLLRDFEKHPPSLVWVNKNINVEKIGKYEISRENRDIIKYLSQQPNFAKIWENYEKIAEIEAEPYPDDEAGKSEQEKNKKPDVFEIYLRKSSLY